MMTDEQYIDIAIEISKNAKYPYGAIVVKDGEIIGRSDDRTLMETSMYSHAELEAIESASQNKSLYGDLKGAEMYVSCEPCMMCMGAILYEEFKKLVYAATLQDSNDNYCSEMVTDIDELVKYSKSKMEIVKELHRGKAVEVLKNHKDKIKNRILVTGAVLVSDESSKDVYKNINSIIGECNFKNVPIEIYSPLDTMNFTGNDYERYERAMNILKDTSIVIAEMSSISTGQGMELQEAIRLNIPILVIAKSGSKISGLVKGCKNVKEIIYYDDIYSIRDEILKFIELQFK